MEKLNQIIGKPIMVVSTAKEVGTIKDAILDAKARQVLGFVVQEKRFGKPAHVLPFVRVSSIGPAAVMVENEQAIIEADADPAIKAAMEEESGPLKSHKMLSQDGREIGSVSDLLIDPQSGSVSWLEASQGAAKDLTAGPLVAPVADLVQVTPEGVVLSEAAQPKPESEILPVQPPAQKVGEKAAELVEAAKEKMKEVTGKAP